jgi:hypothetical protein
LLTGEQVDSLYTLAYKYLSVFEEGKIYEKILDGSNILVSLNHDGKLMQCAQYRLKSIANASSEAKRLIAFINNKAPQAFQLY